MNNAKNWFADFILGEQGPRDWQAGCRQRTPEEQALFQQKLAAALKRWEERKAAERADAKRGRHDKRGES